MQGAANVIDLEAYRTARRPVPPRPAATAHFNAGWFPMPVVWVPFWFAPVFLIGDN